MYGMENNNHQLLKFQSGRELNGQSAVLLYPKWNVLLYPKWNQTEHNDIFTTQLKKKKKDHQNEMIKLEYQ